MTGKIVTPDGQIVSEEELEIPRLKGQLQTVSNIVAQQAVVITSYVNLIIYMMQEFSIDELGVPHGKLEEVRTGNKTIELDVDEDTQMLFFRLVDRENTEDNAGTDTEDSNEG